MGLHRRGITRVAGRRRARSRVDRAAPVDRDQEDPEAKLGREDRERLLADRVDRAGIRMLSMRRCRLFAA